MGDDAETPSDAGPCLSANHVGEGYALTPHLESGSLIHWDESVIRGCIPIAHDVEGTPQVDDEAGALSRAITTWNNGAGVCGVSVCLRDIGTVDRDEGLDYRQAGDNYNLVTYIADNATWLARNDGEQQIAITRITSVSRTGQVLDTDIEVNTGHYQFTLNPDSGGLDLESVLLHELGHLLGFDHVARADSVMQTMLPENTSRRTLGSQDIVGLCEAYACY